jgi:hypothetical protein
MGLRAPSADPAALESALAEDRELLRARLRDWLARPEVLEALFVASPSLNRDAVRIFDGDARLIKTAQILQIHGKLLGTRVRWARFGGARTSQQLHAG